MNGTLLNPSQNDDPRKLREIVQKAASLANDYELSSVMVGVSGAEGDRLFPEMIDYVGSALRMDDAIVRLTRDRAVFLLADADRQRAEEIIERLLNGFRETFTPATDQLVALQYFEVTPGNGSLTVRDVLPALFAEAPVAH
jgi:hypothetical protein